MSDYYELLKVPRDADEQTVKKAYRTLARQHHPDQNKSAFAAEQMKLLNAAYEVLSDPAKQREYDALLATSARQSVTLEPFAPIQNSALTVPWFLRSWPAVMVALGLLMLAALTGTLLAVFLPLPTLIARQFGRATATPLPA